MSSSHSDARSPSYKSVHRWATYHIREESDLIREVAVFAERSDISEELSRLTGHLDQMQQIIDTADGELAMQEYFVKLLAEPPVKGIRFEGAESARPSPELAAAMSAGGLLVLCPSNPFLSLGPIFAVPGIRQGLESFSGPRVAVSPIVGGAALRGPAAKMMVELGHEATCVGVARQYQGLCDHFFIDHQDAELAPAIAALGIQPVITSIIMESEADKISLARQILELADR